MFSVLPVKVGGRIRLQPPSRGAHGKPEERVYNSRVMATVAKLTYAHITHDPKVLGGRACIDDTRIRVLDIVQLLNEGKKPEEMRDVFAVPLTLAQVHAALAYYYDHPDEIEECYRESERWEAEYERDRAEYLSRHQG